MSLLLQHVQWYCKTIIVIKFLLIEMPGVVSVSWAESWKTYVAYIEEIICAHMSACMWVCIKSTKPGVISLIEYIIPTWTCWASISCNVDNMFNIIYYCKDKLWNIYKIPVPNNSNKLTMAGRRREFFD